VIDHEIRGLEAKLGRVLGSTHERSAVGRTALIISLHTKLVALWTERQRVLERSERRA
jgi:hypothetical protein